ncbi:MAG: hypothetical protein WKF30_12945 [Pyrinomonadaceae bacterium]
MLRALAVNDVEETFLVGGHAEPQALAGAKGCVVVRLDIGTVRLHPVELQLQTQQRLALNVAPTSATRTILRHALDGLRRVPNEGVTLRFGCGT